MSLIMSSPPIFYLTAKRRVKFLFVEKHFAVWKIFKQGLEDQRFGSLSTGVANLKSLGNSSAALRKMSL